MQPKNILIVDDEESNHFICDKTIKSVIPNVAIHHAYSGRQALQYITEYINNRAGILDVIMVDVNMPLMNGFEFVAALKATPSFDIGSAQIAMLSSSNDPRDILQAKTLQIEHYFY